MSGCDVFIILLLRVNFLKDYVYNGMWRGTHVLNRFQWYFVLVFLCNCFSFKHPPLLEISCAGPAYASILEQTRKRAAANMVTAAPTFFIEEGQKITGAQPLETFRTALNEVKDKRNEKIRQ